LPPRQIPIFSHAATGDVLRVGECLRRGEEPLVWQHRTDIGDDLVRNLEKRRKVTVKYERRGLVVGYPLARDVYLVGSRFGDEIAVVDEVRG
jgi:hypothetical protein